MPPAVIFSTIKGVEGAVKVGPIEAARFTEWQIMRVPETPNTWEFSGKGEIDQFWSTEGPDVLSLLTPVGQRTWRGVTFEFGDGVVRCTLVGPPEEEK